jgi:SAM-dependent methyltransferase
MGEAERIVGDYWAAERGSGKPYSWLQSPTLLSLLNRRVSGDPEVSTAAWFKQKFFPEPAELCLSLGCGFGGFERVGIDIGISKKFHANDISAGAIEKARQAADAAGMADKISYDVVDLDGDYALPPATYDAIFAISSAHHVFQLENLFRQCRAALKPGGLLFLDEYVGPSRFQTSPLATGIINRLLEALPPQYRRNLFSNDGSTIDHYRPLPAGHFEKIDPSEAIRSGELISTLKMYFDVVEYRPYGGSIMHMLFSGIIGNFDESREIDAAFLKAVSIFEEALEQIEAIQSDYTAVVARPRLDLLDAAMDRPERALVEWEVRKLVAELDAITPPKENGKQTAAELELIRLSKKRAEKLALAEKELQRLRDEIETRDNRLAEVDGELRNLGILMRDAEARFIEAAGAKDTTSQEAANVQRRLVEQIQDRDRRLGDAQARLIEADGAKNTTSEQAANVQRRLVEQIQDRDRRLADAQARLIAADGARNTILEEAANVQRRLVEEIRNRDRSLGDAQARLIEADSAKNDIAEEAADIQRRLVEQIQDRDRRLGKIHEDNQLLLGQIADVQRTLVEEIQHRDRSLAKAHEDNQLLLSQINERDRHSQESDRRAIRLQRELEATRESLKAIQNSTTWRALTALRKVVPRQLRRTRDD